MKKFTLAVAGVDPAPSITQSARPKIAVSGAVPAHAGAVGISVGIGARMLAKLASNFTPPRR